VSASATSRGCARCGWAHSPQSVTRVAGSRFDTSAARGFIADYPGAPVRATRIDAERDWCDWRHAQTPPSPAPVSAPAHASPDTTPRHEPPPAPFPAAGMETAARAKAWCDFLAHVVFSLNVWQLDPALHAECEHVYEWLRRCRDELDAIIARDRQTTRTALGGES
jgi:hypothetical protein